MPIAAVPKYLGQNFRDASPGMRFGMYLALWSRNHQKLTFKDENKVAALTQAQRLTKRDQQIIKSLLDRQKAAFCSKHQPEALCLIAKSIAPFTTGLGNEHPLENGFAFLNPYGLPYLPGSGVKGVLRQAARELASGEWEQTHGWRADQTTPFMQGQDDRRKPVQDKNGQSVLLSQLDLLFGREVRDGDSDHLRGALTFWDVIPQIAGNSLAVEIMTPHQSHYYQQKNKRKSVSPHESGSPTPISFLTVPPNSHFSFHVTCDTALLARRAPDLVENDYWKTLLTAAFEHAFEWLGFGAKTAVGYGALNRDQQAEQAQEEKRLAQAQQAAEEKRLASLSPEEREREQKQEIVEAFRRKFEAACQRQYQPGSHFDQARIEFMKTALEWNDTQSRAAAGELLAQTMTWGTPRKKERKQQIHEAIQALKGDA